MPKHVLQCSYSNAGIVHAKYSCVAAETISLGMAVYDELD